MTAPTLDLATLSKERREFVIEARKCLVSVDSYEVVVANIAACAVAHFSDWCVVHMVDHGASLRRIVVEHVDLRKAETLAEENESLGPDLERALVAVVGSRASTIAPEPSETAPGAAPSTLEGGLGRPDWCSVMIVPIVVGTEAIGTMTFASSSAWRMFTLEDLSAAELVATRIGGAIESARAVLEAKQAEERLHLALESGGMGAWQFDLKTGVVSWSATLEKIHGIPVGSFGGTFEAYESDIHPEDRAYVLETTSRSIAGMAEHRLTYRIIRPDGVVRWLEASGRLFKDSSGRPLRMIGVCSDITHRREAEEQRLTLLARAEQARQAREDLLAMVSHDLRNPLSVITMASGLLASNAVTAEPRVRSQLDKIGRAAMRMEELIANLLDAASIEKGSFTVEPSPIELGSLVDGSLESLVPSATKREVTLRSEIEDRTQLVACDRRRIEQVLGNLLGNAIKFSPTAGSVVVTTRRVSDRVEVSVRDHGPGIALENREHVFDRYWKGDRTGRSGTGLGLFIARGIVEAHGGLLWLESTEGEGSTFRFTLPIALPEIEPPVTGADTRGMTTRGA